MVPHNLRANLSANAQPPTLYTSILLRQRRTRNKHALKRRTRSYTSPNRRLERRPRAIRRRVDNH